MKKELNPAAFWAIIGTVGLIVIGCVYLFATPNVGERAPAGARPPAPSGSTSSGPPPPPPGGFPTHGN